MSAQRKASAEEEENKNKEVFSEDEDCEGALREAASDTAARRRSGPAKQQIIVDVPEVVDDFLRNFLRRAGMSRTLDSFETEWYGSAQQALAETLMPERPAAGVFFVPDALTHRQLLLSELEEVRGKTERHRQEVLAAGERLVRMQRERDVHRLQHRQVAEEKNRLIGDFKRLKKHLESYEPALRKLEDKYQAALRQKTLIGLEKERVQNSPDATPQNKRGRSVRQSDSAVTSSAERRPPSFPPAAGR